MVNDVGVDDAVEEVTADEAKVAVDGGEGTLDEGPVLGVEVGNVGVGVVEVGDGDQPVVDPEVGLAVHQEHHLPADHGRGEVEAVADNGETDVGDEDVDGLAGAEDGAGGLKVADAEPAALALLAGGTGGGVEQEVHLPAGELVENELDELDKGDVLEELAVEVEVGKAALLAVLLGGGDEGHVLLHVTGEAVMAVVRELPGEVGHHESRVEDPANDVVEVLVLGEGAVAGLVSQDPDARQDEALEVAIEGPGKTADDAVVDLGDVGEGSPAKGAGHDEVAEDISHRVEDGWLEAVGGDGIADGLNVGILDHLGLEHAIGSAVGLATPGLGGGDSGCHLGLIVWIWGREPNPQRRRGDGGDEKGKRRGGKGGKRARKRGRAGGIKLLPPPARAKPATGDHQGTTSQRLSVFLPIFFFFFALARN